MTDKAPTLCGDEELFAAFLDWWWTEPLLDGDDPIEPPTGRDMAEVVHDFQTMLRHFNECGFVIVRDKKNGSSAGDDA